MKGSVKKAIIIIGVLIVLVICVLLNLRPVENFQQKYEGVDLSADVEGAVREGTYTKYLNAHEDAACPAEDIEVDLFAYMEGEGVEVYEINGPYFFGIATKFEEIMSELGDRPKVRIVRMRKVPFIDSTGIHNLTNLCEMSKKENIQIVLSGVNEKVHQILEKSGFNELLGKENICPNINVALEKAKAIIEK